MTTALGNFAVVKAEMELEQHKVEMLRRPLDIEAIRKMDVDGGGVDEIEFVSAMLVQICGLNKEKDIDPWREVLPLIRLFVWPYRLCVCCLSACCQRGLKSWTRTTVVP